MERMKWFIFVAVLVFLTACSTEQVTDETAAKLELLEQEYEVLKADLNALRGQNVALVTTNEELRIANDT